MAEERIQLLHIISTSDSWPWLGVPPDRVLSVTREPDAIVIEAERNSGWRREPGQEWRGEAARWVPDPIAPGRPVTIRIAYEVVP